MAHFLHIPQWNAASGGAHAMLQTEERLAWIALIAIPATIVGVGVGLSLLPRSLAAELLTLMLAWTSFSLPLGIMVGHCFPGEQPDIAM